MARRWGAESWEAYADRQVREAQERGEFDHLEGAGRPLPDLHRPRDENWWIRRKLEAEQFVAVPPALQLRREVDAARDQIAAATTEDQVRAILTTINGRIRHANATIISGPPSTVWPLDVERTLTRWRERRGDPDGTTEQASHPLPATDADEPVDRRVRWWRLRRR